MARFIALYLPQFHPVPDNDEHWGKGFTEWTNVGKAKPLFKGHYQPKVPADLGYYDLRLPQVRVEQALMAQEAGIEGFCYWHYWFGNGKRILEMPFNEVVRTGEPDFPFCLCWANHSWSNKTWNKDMSRKEANTIIAEQEYLGVEDYTMHFNALLPAFKDNRYMMVDGKLLFIIWDPNVPQIKDFINTWRCLAEQNGLNGFHFVAMLYTASMRSNITIKERIDNVLSLGFDAVNTIGNTKAEIECGKIRKYVQAVLSKWLKINIVSRFAQADINRHMFSEEDKQENVYPTIMPNWDRSPRTGQKCTIYTNSTPEVFEKSVEDAIDLVQYKPKDHQLIFIRSWNEWGEGNYLEPCIKYGHGYLNAIKNANAKFFKKS